MEEGFFKFSLFSNFREIIHGISQRNYGDMRSAQNRDAFFSDVGIQPKDVTVAGLSHGNKIIRVGQNEKGKIIPLTDGLLTMEKGMYLMVTTADCIPVMFYDSLARIVGVVHAGWRGIIGQIIPEVIGKLISSGAESSNLVVGIGPAICQKHFIVKTDVLEKFKDTYPSATFTRNHDGYVDLKKAVFMDLKNAHIPKENIEISHHCPACLNGIYGSYRKEGKLAPASAAIIGMR